MSETLAAAAKGATMGAALGPVGAVAGAVLGALPGLLDGLGIHLFGSNGEAVATAAMGVVSAVTGKPQPTQEDVASLPPDKMVDLKLGLARIAADQAAATRQADLDQLRALVQDDAAQAAVNNTEAASSSLFVAGWRPFIGWVCGAGLGWGFCIGPLLSFSFGRTMPLLDIGNLLILVGNLLGLAGLRTYEKTKGVSSAH